MKLFGSIRELVIAAFRKDGFEIELRENQSTTYTADRDVQLPPGDADQIIVSETGAQSLSNKTLASPTVSGTLLLQNAAGAQPELHLSEDPDNGTNKIILKAPAALGGDVTLTLPPDDGDTGEALVTNGSGVLTFEPVVTDPTTTQGDILVRGAAVLERLALGTAGYAPQSTGTTLAYRPAQTDVLRPSASYNILDNDGYRTIICTAAPSTSTFSSRASNVITTTAPHNMLTGCPVVATSTGTVPTGLTAGQVYYAIVTGASTFSFALSIANALAGTAVTLSGDGTGTRTFTPGFAIVLPTASANTDRRLTIKKSFSGEPMIALIPEAAAETIEGDIGTTLAFQGDSLSIVCENSLWYIEGEYYRSELITHIVSADTDAAQPHEIRITRRGSQVFVDAIFTTDAAVGTAIQNFSGAVPTWARPTGAISINSFNFNTVIDILIYNEIQVDGDVLFYGLDIDGAGDLTVVTLANSATYRNTLTYSAL